MRKHKSLVIQIYLMMMAGWSGLAFAYQSEFSEVFSEIFSASVVGLGMALLVWAIILWSINGMILSFDGSDTGNTFATRKQIVDYLDRRLGVPGYVVVLLVGAFAWNTVILALVRVVLSPGG